VLSRTTSARANCGFLLIFLAMGIGVFAQEMPNTPQIQSPTSPAQYPSSGSSNSIPGTLMSPLSPGDLIDYSVYGVPEMTQRARLNSSGVVYLPLLDQVNLSGLTSEQAQKKLEDLLVAGGFLRNPHVSITVAEFANGISLLGEVVKPGVYPVSGARRLYDVLAAAGGLTEKAGNQVNITHKDQNDKPQVVTISKDPVKSMDSNVLVAPGDTVVVGKAPIIYVVGEVMNPSGFLLDGTDSFTVLKAIAMAHGTAHGAKLDGTKVIRKNDKGFIEIPVPLSKIMSAKANDIELRADDIVYVPSSAAKNAVRKTLDTAISLATGVTLVRASR
jgi:polysaccharide biosynthesis/export protein